MAWGREEILAATGGKILHGGNKNIFGEVVTDSSQVKKGAVFIALKGERLDGHRFVGEAIRRGAGCVIIHRRALPVRFGAATGIRVRDTLRALGDLAHYRREKLAPTVLAITGSNGKTTTKEMVAAILERANLSGRSLRGRVLKTEGNYNNLVGLPLTLLRLRGRDKVAVVELGTSRPGEIERLSQIADPDVGLITSVAPAHLTGLSTVAGVAREKGALYRGVRSSGKIVVNLEDRRVRRLGRTFRGDKVTYGPRGLVRAESWKPLGANGMAFTLRAGKKRCRVRLSLCGRHNLSNALGAAAMAYAVGVNFAAIREGLKVVKPFPMRMQIEKWRGIGIVNDAYNANPTSMEAALKALAEMGDRGEKIAILGDMLELGRESRKRHRELGRQAARLKVDRLYLFGKQAQQVREGALLAGMPAARVIVGNSHEEIAGLLKSHVRKGDWLLFKGSRGMSMEKVLQQLKGIGE